MLSVEHPPGAPVSEPLRVDDLNHSMIDCLYAVTARRQGLALITADGKLARKLGAVNDMDVRLLSLPESVA